MERSIINGPFKRKDSYFFISRYKYRDSNALIVIGNDIIR